MKFEGLEISKYQPDFHGIKWVLRALSKNNHLIIYDRILFEDGYCVGTDGHRMHIYEYIGKYENGVYAKILNSAGKIMLKLIPGQEYLDWKSLTSVAMKPSEIEITPDCSSTAYTEIIRNVDPSITIQFSYINDLIRSTFIKWIAYVYGASDGIWFMADRRIGLIMPMFVLGGSAKRKEYKK